MDNRKPFIDFIPRVYEVIKFNETLNNFRFEDFSGVQHVVNFKPNMVYVNNRRARSQDPIKKLAASEVVRAEIVKKFDVALSEQKWEVVSIFAGPSGPPQPTSFVPNYNIVSHDLTIRTDEQAMSMGVIGPNSQHRLAMGQLKTGEKVIMNKNVFFEDGKPMKTRLQDATVEKVLEAGQVVNVDVAKVPNSLARFPMYNNYNYITSLIWRGHPKPEVSKVGEFCTMAESTHTGNVILLCNNDDGISTCGLIRPHKFENKPSYLNKDVRVWFDRKDAYLFGVSLENVNLALFLSNYAQVNVYFENDPVPDPVLMKLRQFFGPNDNHVYVKAKFVTKGPILPEDILFQDRSMRFRVDSSDLELKSYLWTNHKFTPDDFEFLVNQVPLNQPALPNVNDQPPSDGTLKGRIFTLKKPKIGMFAVEGYISLNSEKMKTAIVKRWTIFIFGHCLESSNLMDFILPSDEFNVELESDSSRGLLVKMAWIGPNPTYRTRKFPPDPESLPEFREWMHRHNMANRDEFFDCLKGKIPITPFFPGFVSPIVQKESAVVVALFRIRQASEDESRSFGLLRLSSNSEIVPFMSDDLFVDNFNVPFCENLAHIVGIGEKLICETRPAHEDDVVKWDSVFAKAEDSDKIRVQIRSVANLVYLTDSRPLQPTAKPAFMVLSDVQNNERLNRWLFEKRLSPDEFVGYVCFRPSTTTTSSSLTTSKTLPKDDKAMEDKYRQFILTLENEGKTAGSNISLDKLPPPPSFERPFNAERTSKADFDIPLKPISGGSHKNSDSFSSKNPSADESVVFLTQAESIVRRIMKCVALDDPNIKKIISNDSELDLSMFISKALVAAITSYTKSESPVATTLGPSASRISNPLPFKRAEPQPMISLNNPPPTTFRTQPPPAGPQIDPMMAMLRTQPPPSNPAKINPEPGKRFTIPPPSAAPNDAERLYPIPISARKRAEIETPKSVPFGFPKPVRSGVSPDSNGARRSGSPKLSAYLESMLQPDAKENPFRSTEFSRPEFRREGSIEIVGSVGHLQSQRPQQSRFVVEDFRHDNQNYPDQSNRMYGEPQFQRPAPNLGRNSSPPRDMQLQPTQGEYGHQSANLGGERPVFDLREKLSKRSSELSGNKQNEGLDKRQMNFDDGYPGPVKNQRFDMSRLS